MLIERAIGIKENSTGKAILYVPAYHSFVRSDIVQEEPVKGYVDLDVPYTFNYDPKILPGVYDQIENRFLARTPSLGYVIVNNECNMGCTFCYASKNTVPSRGLFKPEWIDKLKSMLPPESFAHPILTGGEPFLDFELVKQLRPKFPHMTINTNGSLITPEIAQWLVDTDTHIYVALDYKVDDFEGHDTRMKKHIQQLVSANPALKQYVKIAVTFPTNGVKQLGELRKDQNFAFEKTITHDFNFVCSEGGSTKADFLQEALRVESGEITVQESCFDRQMRYVNDTILNYMNTESCSQAIHINFRGDLVLCQVRGSELTRPNYSEDVLCNIEEFTPEVYYTKLLEQKKKGVCSIDCPCKYFCANICWANIGINRHNCEVTQNSLFYALWLAINHAENLDITQAINMNTRLSPRNVPR